MCLVTSADELGVVMFSVAFVCVFVCLFVCLFVGSFVQTITQSVIAIIMRFSGINMTEAQSILFVFGDDPDIRPDIRIINFLNMQWICMKIYIRVHNIIIKYL